jgi:hypothetical protein
MSNFVIFSRHKLELLFSNSNDLQGLYRDTREKKVYIGM